jgi:hypothetical protein
MMTFATHEVGSCMNDRKKKYNNILEIPGLMWHFGEAHQTGIFAKFRGMVGKTTSSYMHVGNQ